MERDGMEWDEVRWKGMGWDRQKPNGNQAKARSTVPRRHPPPPPRLPRLPLNVESSLGLLLQDLTVSEALGMIPFNS